MEDILFEEKNQQVGLITLNRPIALNALNHDMILALHRQLKAWEINSDIQTVIIKAVPGRAFCAGGDVRALYEKKVKATSNLKQFFIDEYALNRYIYHYPKPYIALLDGITMGGGAGISLHGRYPVGTENLIFAMPETTIGFFPDVGSSYFLSRLPSGIGLYLGLTGNRIAYQDCLTLKLVKHIIASQTLTEYLNTLLDNPLQLDHISQKFSIACPPSNLLQEAASISQTFQQPSVNAIFQSLESMNNEWASKILATLKSKSPTSLEVTFALLKKAEHLDFNACIAMEESLIDLFLNSHDFFEGIRAALITKDHLPQFRPASIAEVDNQGINHILNKVINTNA